MQTIPLGRTGTRVSELCLGTMYFGTKVDEAESRKLMDRYVERGGTFLDTANAYARWIEGFQGGESESLIGRWLKDRGKRDDLFIATKLGFPTPADGVDFGQSKEQIMRSVENSLKRMGIDTIDLYYAHADDRSTPLEVRLEAFDSLVRDGKVRFVGASNIMDWRMEEARCLCREHGWAEYCCVQQRFSYVRPRAGAVYDPHVAVNEEMLDYVRNRGITLLAYSPLLGGAFVRDDRSFPEQYRGPDTDTRVQALRQVARETGATANQVVLAWMLQSDPPTIPLIAASRMEHLDELISTTEVKLSEDHLERLSTAGNSYATLPTKQRIIPNGAKQG